MIPKAVLPGLNREVGRLILGSTVLSTKEQARSDEILDAFVELGGNCIDLGHIYGSGDCSRAVGSWLTRRGNREGIILLDKGCHPYGFPRVTPAHLEADVADERERLGVATIDLFAFHRDDPAVPVEPLIEKLHELKERGWIRAFGASNWTVARIQEFQAAADKRVLEGFCFSSPNLSLATVNEPMWAGCHTVTAEERAWHQEQQFPLFAWSSAGGGYFSGHDSEDIRRVYANEENRQRRERVLDLAQRRSLSPHQIATAWTLHQPFPVWALAGPYSVPELAQCAASCLVRLSDEEARWLETGRS